MRLALKGTAVAACAVVATLAMQTAAQAVYYEADVPGTSCNVYTQAGADANPQKNPPVELDEDTDVGIRNC